MNERKVKVAISTGKSGKQITEHVGRTLFFKIYEITEDRITGTELVELTKEQSLHNLLHRPVIDFSGHPLEDVEIILTRSIGPGAIHKLFSVGKRAYMIAEKHVDEAIEKLLQGRLQALNVLEHHSGHHHEHGHHKHKD